MDINENLSNIFDPKWLKTTFKIFGMIVAFILLAIFLGIARGELQESIFTRFVSLLGNIIYGAFLYPIIKLQDAGIPTVETQEYLGRVPSYLGLFLIIALAFIYSGAIALIWRWYKNKKQVAVTL